MIYNYAVNKYYEDGTSTNESSSLLETALYITESEGKMFDSLINIDFMDTLQEAESDFGKKKSIVEVVKNIAKKILELLQKVWNAIVNAFKTLIEKLSSMLSSTKSLADKYRSYVTDSKNLKGFEGLDDFPKDLFGADAYEVPSYQKFISIADNLPDKNVDARKSSLEQISKHIETALENHNKAFRKAFETGKFIPDAAFMKVCCDKANDGKKHFIDAINKQKEENLKGVDAARKGAKQQQAKADSAKAADPDYAAAWRDYYTALSKIANYITSDAHIQINAVKLQFKAIRRAIVVVGKYAYAQAKGTGKANESVEYAELLGYKSDAYVESVLEF